MDSFSALWSVVFGVGVFSVGIAGGCVAAYPLALEAATYEKNEGVNTFLVKVC